MYRHYLITRFNLYLEEWQIPGQPPRARSEDWLIRRFELFEQYCLPSVKGQKSQDFKWLVCFDVETPERFKEQIVKIEKECAQFTPLFFDRPADVLQTLRQAIQTDLPPTAECLITTRLDSDDALHEDFIQTVQGFYKPEETYLIDITSGLQLSLNGRTSTVRRAYLAHNPFLSLVEPVSNFETIMARAHLEWRGYPITTFQEKPLWLQVIHEGNVSNLEKKQFPVTNRHRLESFHLSVSHKKRSTVSIFLLQVSDLFARVLSKLKL